MLLQITQKGLQALLTIDIRVGWRQAKINRSPEHNYSPERFACHVTCLLQSNLYIRTASLDNPKATVETTEYYEQMIRQRCSKNNSVIVRALFSVRQEPVLNPLSGCCNLYGWLTSIRVCVRVCVRGRGSSDRVRELYNEKEGAAGKGMISLAVPLSAHSGAAEAPGSSLPLFVLIAPEDSGAPGGAEDPFGRVHGQPCWNKSVL